MTIICNKITFFRPKDATTIRSQLRNHFLIHSKGKALKNNSTKIDHKNKCVCLLRFRPACLQLNLLTTNYINFLHKYGFYDYLCFNYEQFFLYFWQSEASKLMTHSIYISRFPQKIYQYPIAIYKTVRFNHHGPMKDFFPRTHLTVL